MAGLTLDALFKTIEETIESRELDNLKPEIIKRKLLQLSELQTALNKRTVGQVSNEALRRNISEIKEKIIKCEDELWLSFSDDYCLYGDFSDIISIPSTFTAPRAESTLPNPQDESLMIFGLLDELDARSMKLRLYRHLSQLANEHATQHGALHNWAVRLAVFNRRNSALNRINKQLQRVKRKSLKVTSPETVSHCPLMIRVCNGVLTPLLMRHCASTQLSQSFLTEVQQLLMASQVSFASHFTTLWSTLDTSSTHTCVFVLGQLSSILLLFESNPNQMLITTDVAVSISHALFSYFVSLTAPSIQIKENITQKMMEDTSKLLMEMSRDRALQHEDAAWTAPLTDWLLSLVTRTEFRKSAVTMLLNIALFRNSLTDLCHVIKSVENHQSSSWLTFEPKSLLQIGDSSPVSLASYVLGPEVQVLPHIATDGNYYFVRVAQGLFKLGTGEGGTHRNFVYHSNLQSAIKMDDGVTHAPMFHFKSKLVCLSRQRGRSVLVVINGESLKEEKTIEMKEEYIGDNVRVITGDERFYIIRSETTNTTSESHIWLLVDEYTPNADWSAINHVTRVKLNMTKGIEDLVGSSLGSGANEPYSPSMQMDYPETVLGKFVSITAMPSYHNFSFEELRWNYLRKSSNMLGVEDDLLKRMLFHIQDHHIVVALSLQMIAKANDTSVLTRVFSLSDTTPEPESKGAHLMDRVVPVDINLHPIIEMDGLHQLNVSRVAYSTVLTLQSAPDFGSAIATFRWILARINQGLETNYNNYTHQFNQFDDRTLDLLNQLVQYYTQQASTQKLEASNIIQYLQLILTLLQVLKSRILIRCRVAVEWTEITVSILRAIKKNLELLVDGLVLRKLEDTLARPQSSALAQEIKREACEILTIGFEILNPRKSFDEALNHLAEVLAVSNQRITKSVTSSPNSPTLRTTKPLLVNLIARRWGAHLTDWSIRWLAQTNFVDVLTTLVSECSAEAEGWANVGWGIDAPLFKETSSMPPLPLALVRGLLPLLALEDNESAVTTMTPVTKSIIKSACSILKSDWNHHIKPLAKPVTPRPHHIVLSLSKQNLLSRSSPGTLENVAKKPQVLLENNIAMLKQTFIGTVLPYHLNSLVCFFVSSKQIATNLEYAAVVLPYLVKLVGLLENILGSINTHERILDPECSDEKRRKYSWLVDLHHMAIDLSSILGKLLILGEPVMGEERKYKDWLKCKLFLGGLHTQFDHFQENYRKFLNEIIADDPSVSKFLQFMFAGTYRPLGDKGGPEVDRAERAVIATLLKHNNVVEEALLMSQMVGKMAPKQTKSLQHIWDKAYKMRTWILEQSQKSKLITASEDHVRHISQLVTKKMAFLLQLAAAAPGPSSTNTSRAMNRSASHSLLIGEETASNKAKTPVPPKARSSESITVPKSVVSTTGATKRIRSRSGPGLSLSLASLPENEVNDGMQSPSPSAYNYLKQSLKREITRSKSERVFDQHTVEDDKQHRYERIRYSFKMWRRLRARLNQEQENSPRQHVHEISDLIISFGKQELDTDKFSVIMSKQRSRAQHRVTGFVFLSNLLETLNSPILKYSIVMQLKEALASHGVCYYYLSKVTTCGSELTEQLVKAFERFYAQLVAMLRSQETPSEMKLQLLILLSVRFRDNDHNFLQEVGMFNVLMRMITSAVKTPAPVEAENSISPREKIPEESRKTLHYGTWLLLRILTIVCMRREELPNQPRPVDELQKQIFELVFSQIEKMSGRLFHVLQEDQVCVEQDILSKSESRKKVDLESSISSDDELDNGSVGFLSRQSSSAQVSATDGDILEIAEGAWLCYDLVLLLHIICKTSLKALSYMSTPRLIKVLLPFMLLGTSQLQAITISLLKKVLPSIKPKIMSSLLRDVARDYQRKDVPQGVLAFMFQLIGMSVCPALVIHLNPHTALSATEKKLKDLAAEARPATATQPFNFEAPIASSRSMPNLFNVPSPTVTGPPSQGFQFTIDWPQTGFAPLSPPTSPSPVPNFDFNPFAVTLTTTAQSPPERRIRRAGRFRTQQQGSQQSTGFSPSTSFSSAPRPLIRIARDGYTNMALAADIVSLIRSVASTDQWKQRVKTSLSHALNGLKAVKTPGHVPLTTTTEALVLSPSASVVWEAVAALMAIGCEQLALRVGSRVGLMFKQTAHNLDDTYKTGTLIEINTLTGKGKVAFSFMEQPVTVSLDKLEPIDQTDDFDYKQADLLPVLGKYLESKEDYFNDVYWENNAEVLIYCRVKSLVIIGLTRLLKSAEVAKEFIDLGLLSSLLDTTLRHAPKLHAIQRYEVEYHSISLLEESVRHHNMLYKWNQRLKFNPLSTLPIFVPYKWSTNYQGSKYMAVEGCEGLTAVIVSPKDMLKRRRASSNLIAPYSLPGFYFEVEVNCLDAANGIIEVGLCDSSMHLDACDFKTYHTYRNTGQKYWSINSAPELFGSKFGHGDVVGCGWDMDPPAPNTNNSSQAKSPHTISYFWTLNGRMLDYGYRNISAPSSRGAFAIVTAKSVNGKIIANFGQKPFLFNLAAHWSDRWIKLKAHLPSPEHSPRNHSPREQLATNHKLENAALSIRRSAKPAKAPKAESKAIHTSASRFALVPPDTVVLGMVLYVTPRPVADVRSSDTARIIAQTAALAGVVIDYDSVQSLVLLHVLDPALSMHITAWYPLSALRSRASNTRNEYTRLTSNVVQLQQRSIEVLQVMWSIHAQDALINILQHNSNHVLIYRQLGADKLFDLFKIIYLRSSPDNYVQHNERSLNILLDFFTSILRADSADSAKSSSDKFGAFLLSSCLKHKFWFGNFSSKKTASEVRREFDMACALLRLVYREGEMTVKKKYRLIVFLFFVDYLRKPSRPLDTATKADIVVLLLEIIHSTGIAPSPSGVPNLNDIEWLREEVGQLYDELIVRHETNHISKPKLNYLKALVELMLAIRAIGWDTSADDMDVLLPVTLSSSPVLPAHETPVAPERLDSTQAIEKPKVTANHVFNPVVHQSVFHQINLWTRVREQLTPQMSDIPSALVIEAFIYNKTRRTFNFKVDNEPHEGSFDISSRARVIPLNTFTREKLTLYQTKEGNKEALKLGEQSYVAGPVVQYSIQPLSVKERQQLCSIALIPQLDFDQKAKWIQDPALPNLLHEIAGIDQVVSAAHRSPRSPGCKAKPVCSGLWLVLVELVALLNCRLDESNDVTSPYAVWPHLPLKESEKVLYSALWTALDHSTDPSALLTHLTAVIHVLNGLVEPVSNLFQLEDVHNQTWRTGYALLSSRALLFRSLKWSIIQSELKLMTDGEPNADPPVTLDLNRFLTSAFNPSQNGSTLDENCIFLQAYAQLKNVEAHKLFNRSKSWHVKFKNEEGIDSGGLFRESLTLICNDLQSNRLPIFIPCPNAQLADKAEGSGHNRNKWIPNPSCSHPRYQKLYEFVGRLLGLALWTDNTLPLDLPSFVWKPLLGQELCLEDLKDIDSYCGECLSFLTSDRDGDLTENNFNDIIFEYFQTVLSDGTVVDLKPNGAEIPVTYANRLEYVSLVQKTRLRESDKQLQWLRQGLSQVVPVGALSLLSWSELQDKVTGVPLIDIDLLRQHTRYELFAEDDPTIVMFWKVLTAMRQQERRLFLRFVWGRETLPSPLYWREEMVISKLLGKHDELPQSHTCFFVLKLPTYSNDEIMSQKLIMAITHTQTIDTDFNL